MFTVTQRVKNTGTKAVTLYPYGFISRTGTPEILGFFILHEGPLGVFNGTLKEVDYDDLRDDGKIVQNTQGGWIGITDKYWLAALVALWTNRVSTVCFWSGTRAAKKWLWTSALVPGVTVRPGPR